MVGTGVGAVTAGRTLACYHHARGECRSCTWLPRPYEQQLSEKERACRALLAPWPGIRWEPAVEGGLGGFRNKAKLAVGGAPDAPTLGILDPAGQGVDLRDCALHDPRLVAAADPLAELVVRAQVTPYDVVQRRGELKHLLVTVAPDGGLLVRFVLRSEEAVTRIRKHLPWLLARLPEARVVSVNLQPDPKAVLEGPREIVLTDEASLRVQVNDLDLHLLPQSFFQTNTAVAAALYRQVADWVDEVAPGSVWDLYCGVGGFALHVAAPGRRVVGVEVSEAAVESARRSAADHRLSADFVAADAVSWVAETVASAGPVADLVVVNPPRRGIGPRLARLLEKSRAEHVVYSSCNAVTLARDLEAMPSLRPARARLLDMFPHTAHYEAVVLLERASRPR
ncbi:23S rRNA (uracil(747)-C(5))-methyltransferase RlmC [Nocardioides zeae]|uniref:23S rRNA (Uracil747-C5)-methyltransferase n=1 Tax=Nocardioides zeae TaxID=1457234 RepID=A0AAJ1X496_9ACTN|nr:23S rRNA (uracil(747)-C(5))-methyltransferase RlmC [Nocardioides zeae]MDQ1106599.1 23S rRNA (uracil747-C5)-methyltransferase [Nocardioides zeae]